MKIGPTGEYPAGKPYFKGDLGNIDSGFAIEPPNCVWMFGALLDYIILTPEKARPIVEAFRSEIAAVFPDAKPATKLKGVFICSEADLTIRIEFTAPIPKLVAKPEVFLAIAEKIEKEIQKIARHR